MSSYDSGRAESYPKARGKGPQAGIYARPFLPVLTSAHNANNTMRKKSPPKFLSLNKQLHFVALTAELTTNQVLTN